MPHLLAVKIISIVAYSVFTVTLFNAQQNSNILQSFFDSTKLFAYTSQNNADPCKNPISYAVGSLDSRFGIAEEELVGVMNDAAGEWNRAWNKSLFVYAPDGSIKVNLVYDVRQEDTQKLKKIDPVIDKMETSINALDEEFKVKKKQYDKHKLRIAALKNDDGLHKKELAVLEAEKIAAKKIVAQRDLLYKKYEDAVNNYNALSISRRGEDFFVGSHYKTNDGEQLDIYEFYSKQDLKRVLMHELGHSLGLDHASNPNDIMNEWNKAKNEKPTVGDMVALGRLCGDGNTIR